MLALISAAALLFVRHEQQPPPPPVPPGPSTPISVAVPHYAGNEACGSCHQPEHSSWHGSDHDLAMQVASDASVLGNFKDAKFTYAGTTSTFLRRDGKFIVNTDGPDGQLRDYEIGYTFGVHPLQQYLIDFPMTANRAENRRCRSRGIRDRRSTVVSVGFISTPTTT